MVSAVVGLWPQGRGHGPSWGRLIGRPRVFVVSSPATWCGRVGLWALPAIIALAVGFWGVVAPGWAQSGGGRSGAVSESTVGQVPDGQEPEQLTELPELRTATSRTYAHADGLRETVVYAAPVNYRDGSGDWVPIDNTLRPDGRGNLVNASSIPVVIPQRLDSGPVTIAHDGDSVSFGLVDAQGSAAVSGTSATFAAARPGVGAL